MGTTIIFTPVSEKITTLDHPISLQIIKERSKTGSSRIVFPNTPTILQLIDDFGNHCAMRILRDGVTIFDGDFHNDNTGNNQLSLQCWDKSYWIKRNIRSFTQTTDNITASEAFIQAFDSASTFSYWTPVFNTDTYNTPFANAYSYDATTHVVPVDVADEYTDFFDGQGINGHDFINNLVAAAKRGNNYRYYYWYDYIDDQRYLYFQPDGWGKTVDLGMHLDINRDRNRDNVWNNIHVWGTNKKGYMPTGEKWTETSISGWDPLLCTLSLGTTANVGNKSLQIAHGGASTVATISHSLERNDEKYPNFETMCEVGFDIYVPVGLFQATVIFSVNDISAVQEETDPYNISVGGSVGAAGWETITFTIPTDWVPLGGGIDFTNLSWCSFDFQDIGLNNFLTGNWFFDNFYIKLNPIKSDNIAVTSGYDSTSETSFGLKETKITIPWLRTVADCNAIAEPLVNYFAELHPVITYSVPYYSDIKLNDNVKGTFYGTEYTLPVHKIIYDLNQDGLWITTVQLGGPLLVFNDIINKHDVAIKYNQYDSGLTYNIV